MKHVILLLCVLLIIARAVPTVHAAEEDILGVWNNQEKDAKIEIAKCGDAYCGKIVWLKEPNYPAGSRNGTPGTPKLNHHSPDPALRSQPIVGLQVIQGFVFAGDNLWKDGFLYDPKNGKTYSGKITLVSPHELHLRGFVGFSWIGRTAIWTR